MIEHLGYAKAFEIYMKHKYDLVKLYPLEEDFVCLNVDLDEFILEIVGNSLKRLRLILKNDYEDFKDEDRLFMEVSEAYYVFPNDNAFIEYFEEHNFLVYQLESNEKSYFMLWDNNLEMFYKNHLGGNLLSTNAYKESIPELFELLVEF